MPGKRAGYYYSIQRKTTKRFVAYGGPHQTKKEASNAASKRRKREGFTSGYTIYVFYRSK